MKVVFTGVHPWLMDFIVSMICKEMEKIVTISNIGFLKSVNFHKFVYQNIMLVITQYKNSYLFKKQPFFMQNQTDHLTWILIQLHSQIIYPFSNITF